MAFEQQRAKGKRLGRGPVDACAGLDRLAALLEKALDDPMQVKTLRHRGDLLADIAQRGESGASAAAARIVGVARRLDVGPAPVEPVRAVGLVALACFEL